MAFTGEFAAFRRGIFVGEAADPVVKIIDGDQQDVVLGGSGPLGAPRFAVAPASRRAAPSFFALEDLHNGLGDGRSEIGM